MKRAIPIEIERPRKLRVKRDPRFLRYEDEIWALIENEVKKSALSERSSRGSMAEASLEGA